MVQNLTFSSSFSNLLRDSKELWSIIHLSPNQIKIERALHLSIIESLKNLHGVDWTCLHVLCHLFLGENTFGVHSLLNLETTCIHDQKDHIL